VRDALGEPAGVDAGERVLAAVGGDLVGKQLPVGRRGPQGFDAALEFVALDWPSAARHEPHDDSGHDGHDGPRSHHQLAARGLSR
jgi:hypothetical protein